MTNAKRLSALILTVIMIVAMFAGCNTGAGTTTTTTAKGGEIDKSTQIEIDVLFSDHDSQPYSADTWLLPQKALEKFNIKMNMNAIPSASFNEKRNTTLAGGDLPDLVMGVDKSTIDEYGPLGMFLNIYDYIDIMPNMAAAMENFPDLKATMYSPTEMYGMAAQMTTSGAVNTSAYFIPMIRADIMDELNLENPTTYDEFYNVLKAMKDAYPDSYPWVNRQKINFIVSVMNPGLGINAFPDGLSGTGFAVWKEDTKTFTSILDEPNFKEFITFMNKLYNDGLLDPSYATDDTQTWESKIVSGAGMFAVDYFARPEMMSTSGVSVNPNYSLEAMLVPTMEGGSQTVFSRLGIGSWNVIDAKTANPERLMEFIDWWRYTEEGSLLMTYGVEGEHFTINEDKTITKIFLPGVTNSLDQDAKLGTNYMTWWSFRPDYYGYDLYDKDATYHTNQVWELVADKQIASPPTLIRNADENAALAEYSVDLLDVQRNTLNEMIMGVRPVSDWDKVVKEWADAGYTAYLEQCNAVYARIYG